MEEGHYQDDCNIYLPVIVSEPGEVRTEYRHRSDTRYAAVNPVASTGTAPLSRSSAADRSRSK